MFLSTLISPTLFHIHRTHQSGRLLTFSLSLGDVSEKLSLSGPRVPTTLCSTITNLCLTSCHDHMTPRPLNPPPTPPAAIWGSTNYNKGMIWAFFSPSPNQNRAAHADFWPKIWRTRLCRGAFQKWRLVFSVLACEKQRLGDSRSHKLLHKMAEMPPDD